MKPYIVFDFDGTLADSRPVFIQSYNEIAAKYRFHLIHEGNIDALKKLPMLERFRQLKVPLWSLPFLTKKFLRSYHQRIADIPFMDGMKEMLEELFAAGYNISILSSNSTKTITTFLRTHNMTTVSGVYSSGKLFKKEKLLLRFIKKHRIRNSDLIYIGDELRDVAACRKVGIPVVWVSWGFEDVGVFGDQPPVLIAHSPAELSHIIRAYQKEKQNSDDPLDSSL